MTRRGVALLVAVVLALGGGAAIAWAVTHQESAPQPSAAARGTSPPSASSTGGDAEPGGPSPRGPILAASKPVRIEIPAIGVASPVQPIGRAPDGSLAAPSPGPHYDEAAWFSDSPTPGELGPSIIEGHVDSTSGPSVFFRLGDLRPGDSITVTRADRSELVFVVDGVQRYPKDEFPTTTVYGNTENAALRLITCGGEFDRASGHYESNVVAYAHLKHA